MNKYTATQLLANKPNKPSKHQGQAFAPSNIALIKYWGKRNQQLNLPNTSSLSISLGNKGTQTQIEIIDSATDKIILNGEEVNNEQPFAKKLVQYLDLFRQTKALKFCVTTENNIPTAAGLASSASGFAALIKALNDLFSWQLSAAELSTLARLGSGSACRSLWHGFVEWQPGTQTDGMDSHGLPLDYCWPELRVGLLINTTAEKAIGSRQAMQQTIETSSFYQQWPKKVADDLAQIKIALANKDFNSLGSIAESNALAMHATMLTAWPPICYWNTQTLKDMQQIWQLRQQQNLPVYFTEDAGPNLKLLFLEEYTETIQSFFPDIEMINPFEQVRSTI